MTLTTLLAVLAVWTAISFPFALLVARFLAAGKPDRTGTGARDAGDEPVAVTLSTLWPERQGKPRTGAARATLRGAFLYPAPADLPSILPASLAPASLAPASLAEVR